MADQTVSLKLDGDADGLIAAVNESGDAMEELAGQSTQAGEEIEASVTGASSAWEDHGAAISGAAVAVGAMGAAVEGLARSQQDTRAVAGRLANALEGETTDSVMGLAAEIHNATTDLDELVHMMEVGSQQGIDSAADLQEYALFWDMVGDATGETAGTLADASIALRAVGIDAGREADALDAFGFIAQETTGSVGEFLTFLERTGPELRELGVDIDGAAALLGILEEEFGLSGRVARTEFRQAVNESNGDLGAMLDTLGISTEMFEDYRGQVSESSDVIRDNAASYAETRTRMQELSATMEGFLARHSGLVDGMSALSPVLMGAGGAVWGFRQLGSALGPIPGHLRNVASRAGGAAGAMRGLGIAGVVAGGLWAADEALEAIGSTLLDWVHGPIGNVNDMTLALEGLAATGEIPESVVGSIEGIGSALDGVDLSRMDQFRADVLDLPVIGRGIQFMHPGERLFAQELERDIEMVENFDQALADLATSGNEDAVAAGLDALSEATGLTGDALDELVAEHFPEYARALDRAAIEGERAGDSADDFADGLDGLSDSADEATGSTFDLIDSMEEYLDAVRAAEDPVFALDRALQAVDEAQQAYNDALDEYGAGSAEAQQASLDLMRRLGDLERAALDGDLSFGEFERRLQAWVDQGHITAEQASEIRDRVNDLRESAEDMQGIYAMTLTANDQASGIIQNVIDRLGRIPDVTPINLVPRTGGGSTGVGTGLGPDGTPIGGFADGGFASAGTLAWVGEEGPELGVFGQDAHIFPANHSEQIMAGFSGGQDIHVRIDQHLDGRHIGQSSYVIDAMSGAIRSRNRDMGRV